MKQYMIFLLFCAASISAYAAADVFEATVLKNKQVTRNGDTLPAVDIRKLTVEEATALEKACGGDFSTVQNPKKVSMPAPHYPFEMRRNGETATVTCLVEYLPNGRAGKVYRLGTDSDKYFIECARAIWDSKLKDPKKPGYYKLALMASLGER